LECLSYIRDFAANDDQLEWRAILTPKSVPGPTLTLDPAETSNELSEKADAEPSARAALEVLPAAAPFIGGTPGCTSEFCGLGGAGPVADYLGVEDLAQRLAELIALRETKLPLAVGLFGNWGSGKSHFMNLMDRHIKSLSLRTPTITPRLEHALPGPWCQKIVPIYFNAWHYSDSNLWASLITEVFDKLFAHIEPKPDDLEALRERLRSAGGVTALAEEEVRNANEGVRRAAAEVQSARVDSEGKTQIVRGLLDGLRTLLPELNEPQARERVTELLGISPDEATLSELIEKNKELRSITGRARELWRRALAPEGRAARCLYLAMMTTTAIGIHFAAVRVPQIKAILSPIGQTLQEGIVLLGAILSWMTPVFRQMQRGLRQIERWQKQAEDAQANMRVDPRVIEAKKRKVLADARAIAADAALVEA
jgi:hypothetical protein